MSLVLTIRTYYSWNRTFLRNFVAVPCLSMILLSASLAFGQEQSRSAVRCERLYEANASLTNARSLSAEFESAKATDVTEIINFIRSVRLSMGLNTEMTADGRSLYADLQDFPTHFETSKAGFLLLRGTEGRILATASFVEKSASTCELKRFYVDPSLHGLGVGKKLLLKIMESAVHVGYREIILQTDASMASAILLYEKLGFVEQHVGTGNNLEGSARYFKRNLGLP
jgi:putative acetyltransferase